eukprot:gene10429-29166_t
MRGALPSLLLFVAPAAARPGVRYRAAVVEIGSPATPASAKAVKLRNADMIDSWAAKAAAAGAQIVVFGEDFADSGWALPPGAQNMYAEPLPQPGPASLCAPDTATPLASAHNITVATGLHCEE